MDISRRKMIQTAALSLALPSFETFASFDKRAPLKRMVAFYVPNGMHMEDFYCHDKNKLENLPPTLKALEAVKEKITLVGGLVNEPANPDGAGDHASGTASFLTVAHPKKTNGNDIFNGISIDQVIANPLREQTRLASLQLGLDGGGSVGDCDSGYSCAYARNISWANATQPLPKIVKPQLLFNQLFEGSDPDQSAQLRKLNSEKQKSILDYVMQQTNELNQQLSYKDKAKLDQYRTGIRELELKLAKSDVAECESFSASEFHLDDEITEDVNKHSDIMTELMVMALQCEQTSVVSYMLANAGSNRNYDFLGVEGAHHEISHHQKNQANYEKLKKINKWEIDQYAKLVYMLDSVEEGEGTLLDNCCVFLSSEVSDGDRHNHDDLPFVYAGGLGNKLKTGQNIDADDHSIAEFFISVAHGMGVPVKEFGDSKKPLKSVFV